MSNIRLTSPIPNNTKEALKLHNWQIDNIALLLSKYLDFCIIKNDYIIEEFIEPNKVKQLNFLPILKDNNVFFTGLNKVFEHNERKNKYKIVGYDFEKDYVRNLKTGFKIYRDYLLQGVKQGKIKEVVNKIIERQYQVADCTFRLKTQTRLIVGLGSGSVLETSIKLHHIYGIPYIPASAIKGILRAYRIWELAKWNEDKFKEIENRIDETKLDNKEEEKIIEIFGNQQQKGKLIVLDAYPINFEGFDVDIMNPHFPDYYDKGEPPADWQNPNPITFLAIPENTEFNFYFKNTSVYDGNLKEELKEAFENIGIGAKTALGYGILE